MSTTVKTVAKIGPINVNAWALMKTVLKTDLDYWRNIEGQVYVVADMSREARAASLSMASTSISLIEYYIDIMDKIESGELSASGGKQES